MNKEDRTTDNVTVKYNLPKEEAFEGFMDTLRKAIVAATEGGAAEVDVERVVEGESTLRITIRRVHLEGVA